MYIALLVTSDSRGVKLFGMKFRTAETNEALTLVLCHKNAKLRLIFFYLVNAETRFQCLRGLRGEKIHESKFPCSLSLSLSHFITAPCAYS